MEDHYHYGNRELFVIDCGSEQRDLSDVLQEPPIAALGSSVASSDSVSSWIPQIENFLMEDAFSSQPESPPSVSEKECDDFVAQLIVDFSGDVDLDGQDKDSNNSAHHGIPATPAALVSNQDEDNVDEQAEDPISKKKRRQMRNRESAVRSRERKRMYVKDLEMKSRYLEGECRRLGRLLHCCYAENHALRLTLQSLNAPDAPTPKLESAVLLLETLLLVSPLWFLGTLCILLQEVPRVNVEAGLIFHPVKRGLERVPAGGAGREMFEMRSSAISRRCKASRTKMKFGLIAT